MACVGLPSPPPAGASTDSSWSISVHTAGVVGVLSRDRVELVLDQIEEGIDLVLVVAALADGWLAERNVVTSAGVSGIFCPLDGLDRQSISKCRASVE
jgi:hypothetical protein